MKFKWTLLFLTIGLPVAIYIFLQVFGENKFDIPTFYELEVPQTLEGCDSVYEIPYAINHFSVEAVNKITLYGFITGDGFSRGEINNVSGLLSKYADSDSVVFMLLTTDILLASSLETPITQWEVARRQTILDYARCSMQLDMTYEEEKRSFQGNMLVMVDTQRRIRGYYDTHDLEEMDRLNTELDILLINE